MGTSLFLYNLGLWLGTVFGLPIWGAYLLSSPKARAGLAMKLGNYPQALRAQLADLPPGKKRIWFHAVSVGEFNAIRPLVNELANDYQIVISTTTRTGNELARRVYPELPVLYFPLDFRPSVQRALKLVRPDVMILAETEIWPNFIDQVARKQKRPLLLINGRISPGSFKGYRFAKSFIKPVLQKITHCYMQSQGDVERLRALGNLSPERMTVAGNLKFDINPVLDPMQKHILSHLLNISPADTVLTLASTHAGEESVLVETYLQLRKDFPELKLIIAPRHPERVQEVKSALTARMLSYSLRSKLSETQPNQEAVVILDTIGELLTVYSLSTVAVMGGSFIERGGQNPLEALSQRIPVIFGPHMSNFPEISWMILEHQAGFQAHSQEEVIRAVTELLTQPEIYSATVENGQQLLENNRGAKAILADGIREQLLADE